VILLNTLVKVKFISSTKGKGLFAENEIQKGEIIDNAHVILIPNKEYRLLEKTSVSNYCFTWENPKYKSEFKNAIAMSICQFMNHSYNPNVRYQYNYKNDSIKFIALRKILKDEELTINYNGSISDQSPVWFKVSD
jgi:SET domain-containing protein